MPPDVMLRPSFSLADRSSFAVDGPRPFNRSSLAVDDLSPRDMDVEFSDAPSPPAPPAAAPRGESFIRDGETCAVDPRLGEIARTPDSPSQFPARKVAGGGARLAPGDPRLERLSFHGDDFDPTPRCPTPEPVAFPCKRPRSMGDAPPAARKPAGRDFAVTFDSEAYRRLRNSFQDLEDLHRSTTPPPESDDLDALDFDRFLRVSRPALGAADGEPPTPPARASFAA